MKRFINRASFWIGVALLCGSFISLGLEFSGIWHIGHNPLLPFVTMFAYAFVFAIINHATKPEIAPHASRLTSRPTLVRRLGKYVGWIRRPFRR